MSFGQEAGWSGYFGQEKKPLLCRDSKSEFLISQTILSADHVVLLQSGLRAFLNEVIREKSSEKHEEGGHIIFKVDTPALLWEILDSNHSRKIGYLHASHSCNVHSSTRVFLSGDDNFHIISNSLFSNVR
jgi:hypothetical protein